MDALYLKLLTHGLPRVRDLCEISRFEEAGIEAEHLHNLPSLIGESNKLRHLCYLEKERPFYLDRIHALDNDESKSFVISAYAGLWKKLEVEIASM